MCVEPKYTPRYHLEAKNALSSSISITTFKFKLSGCTSGKRKRTASPLVRSAAWRGGDRKCIASWWLNHGHLKNMRKSNWIVSPQIGGMNIFFKTCLKPPARFEATSSHSSHWDHFARLDRQQNLGRKSWDPNWRWFSCKPQGNVHEIGLANWYSRFFQKETALWIRTNARIFGEAAVVRCSDYRIRFWVVSCVQQMTWKQKQNTETKPWIFVKNAFSLKSTSMRRRSKRCAPRLAPEKKKADVSQRKQFQFVKVLLKPGAQWRPRNKVSQRLLELGKTVFFTKE